MNTELIKRLRKENGFTQKEIADRLGIDRTTYGKYETGDSNPDNKMLIAIAKLFEVSVAELLGVYEENKKPSTRKIPLLGKIACGNPIEAIERPSDYVDVPEFVSADFALTCQGDSMINARINDGDIVYIRKQPQVENGEIAAVLIDSEATLKRVFYSPGTVTLIAENPAFPPLVFTGSAAEQVRILGKATYFVSKVR